MHIFELNYVTSSIVYHGLKFTQFEVLQPMHVLTYNHIFNFKALRQSDFPKQIASKMLLTYKRMNVIIIAHNVNNTTVNA